MGGQHPKARSRLRLQAIEREERLAHLGRLWARWGKAWSQQRYAEEMGVHPSTVCRMLKLLERRWRDESSEDYEKGKARIFRHLEDLRLTALEAYERTVGDHDVVTVKEYRDQDGNPITEKTIRRERRAGDAALLSRVLDAIAQQRALFGYDKPKAFEINDVSEPQAESDERLRDSLRRRLEAARISRAAEEIDHSTDN